jgi:crotonobetainyl-CoA:carnitine CoA-transferase CaiB-like acyl-CoA transferase
MASALDGTTVLELSQTPAGAMAGMFLCDHGARVIRLLDSNAPATRRGGYLVWDRGKACRRLDLSRGTSAPPHAAAYERLIRTADVVLEDFPPSSDRQALVRPDWLAALNPRLVHCSITGYGKRGPLKDEPAIDELVMARMGILATMPGYRPGPVHVVHPLPSVGAALFAAIGIAAALLAREKTGRGRTVETSLMAGSLLYQPKVVAQHLEPRPFQTHPAGSGPFYSVYACADGNWVQLGCVHLGFIRTAAKVMGIPDVLDDPRYGGGQIPVSPEADLDLRARIADAIATQPYVHWAECFDEADVPYALARTTEAGMRDPQVQANGMVETLVDPEVGPLAQMGVPVRLSRTPGRIQGPRALPDTASSDLSEAGVAPTPDAAVPLPESACDLPLKGVRVLEITNLIAGPIAGRLLADLGADVIKVEPHAGDISRPLGRTYFFNVNVNKRSLCLSTRDPGGKIVAQKVAATADVMLANLRPGATERMGLAADDLRRLNPRLIETHVTGFGATGPYAHRPGIDPLSQALMGLSRAQGGTENPPVFPAQLAPTDYTAGAMGTYGTILALLVRERTGQVQRVDTNLLNGGIVLTSEWFTRYAGKPARPLADKGQYGLTPFHRLYELKDGWLYVAADTPADRRALCEALGCEADAEETGALSGAGEGHPGLAPPADALARRFASLDLTEAARRLRSANVPCAPVVGGDSEIFLDDPHADANRMVLAYEHPVVGHMLVAGHYVQFGNTPAVAGKPTPLLGQHTQDMLREVGYTEDAIADLYGKAVVKTEETCSP